MAGNQSEDAELNRDGETALPHEGEDAPTKTAGPMGGSGAGVGAGYATTPAMVGPYRIMELLGEGGMGSVYKAEQRAPLRRIVAIKLVKAGFDTAEVIARFAAEHQALARLDHPNIAKVFDAGTTDLGRPYFVMEYIPGQPLTRFCDENQYSIRERLELFVQACDAIGHAHIKAIVHRDIKAANVLAFLQDGKPMVKVIDFGIAKALTGDRLSAHTFFTGQGVVIGTYNSMSPEQAEGSADIDTRTDVYSMGVLLYELLTGAKPFEVNTLSKAADVEIRRMIREVNPPRPSTRFSSLGESASRVAKVRQARVEQLARELKGDLEWIPLKAMRKERHGRYASMLQMSEDIENYLGGRPLLAGPESAVYRAKKFVRRNRRSVVSVAIGGVIAVTAGSVHSYLLNKSHQETLNALAAERVAHQKQQTELALTYLQSADLAAQRGRWAEALQAYGQADREGSQDHRAILVGSVYAMQNLGRSRDSQKAMQDWLGRYGELANDPLVMARRGELLWSSDPKQAELLLRRAMEIGLSPGELAFAQGLLAESIPDAIDHFKKVLITDPFRQDAIGMVALLSTLLGRTADADNAAIAWQGMYPDDPAPRTLRAVQFALEGDMPKAQTSLADASAISPEMGKKLRASVELLGKLNETGVMGGTLNVSNTFDFFTLLFSLDREGFGQSNLLFPRLVGGCGNKMVSAFSNYSKGTALQQMKMTALANVQFDQAAELISEVEKQLPIGIVYLMRAEALSAAGHHLQAIDEYENAYKADSPVEVRGYSHLETAFSYLEIDVEAGRLGAAAAKNEKAGRQFVLAAQLGALGKTDFYWATAACVTVAGRHTNDARDLISLWRQLDPGNPLTDVWEAQTEYFAGNFVACIHLLDELEKRYPDRDFSAMAVWRSRCLKAIEAKQSTPPPESETTINPGYAVPKKATTQPS